MPEKSAFTPYLSRGIRGDADWNHDGYVTATELAEDLKNKVAEASGNTVQFGPLPNPDFDQGDMVFVPTASLNKKPDPITIFEKPITTPAPPSAPFDSPEFTKAIARLVDEAADDFKAIRGSLLYSENIVGDIEDTFRCTVKVPGIPLGVVQAGRTRRVSFNTSACVYEILKEAPEAEAVALFEKLHAGITRAIPSYWKIRQSRRGRECNYGPNEKETHSMDDYPEITLAVRQSEDRSKYDLTLWCLAKTSED